MIKPLLRRISVAAFVGMTALGLNAEPFEYEENFDDDSHFAESEVLPDGWLVTNPDGTAYSGRTPGNWTAVGSAHSGDYLLDISSSHKDIVYTPLYSVGAGKEYILEFYVIMPGGGSMPYLPGYEIWCGKSQNIDEMTKIGEVEPAKTITEWTLKSYNYVPEEDGEYCFAIKETMMSGFESFPAQGGFHIDDVFISGETAGEVIPPIDLDPDPDNLAACVDLPYNEYFDGTNYNGTTIVPSNGWKTVGTMPIRTGNTSSLAGQNDEWYLILPESGEARDERLYTPFFNLVAGREYTIQYYSHFGGYNIDGNMIGVNVDLTVGTQQDADFHVTTLASTARGLDADGEWVLETVKFKPEIEGPYCFSFNITGEGYTGWYALDSFYIGSPQDINRVEPAMYPKGLFSYMDSSLLTFSDDEQVLFVNRSKYADSYEWEAPEGTAISVLDNGDAKINFPASGEYSVKLSGTNVRGTRSTSKTILVNRVEDDVEGLPLLSYDPNAVKMYDRGNIPSFDTDVDGLDFVSGYNHYYRKFAERYDLPSNGEFAINTLTLWLTNLAYRPMTATADNQRLCPFNVVVYGSDANGNLDETKKLGSWFGTMEEVFGPSGIGGQAGEGRQVIFEEPVKASGTVYIAFEFSNKLQINVDDPNVGRSFLSMGMVKHYHGISTLYVKPYALPEGVAEEVKNTWCPVETLDSSLAGMGLNWQVWADYSYENGGGSGIGLNNTDNTSFAVRMNGNMLTISGAEQNDIIYVYGVDGSALIAVPSADGQTLIDCSALSDGIYIVKCSENAAKFVK